MRPKPILLIFLTLFWLVLTRTSYSQSSGNPSSSWRISGDLNLTQNGISNIPAFSLNKPALITSLNAAKSRFSVHPQAAFALNGKPWFMTFWVRYKVVDEKKFELRSGLCWVLSFKEVLSKEAGAGSEKINRASRYVFTELAPRWNISARAALTLQYWYGHSIESDGVKNIHFVRLEGNFSRIPLMHGLYLKMIPQVFYLNQDQGSGYFATLTVRTGYKNLPLQLGFLCNQPVYTKLESTPGFIWNVHALYSF